MMEHDPNYAGAHYAMALAAEHKGDKAGALEMFATAEKFWRNADADLPELLETRARIAQLRK
jgi:Tfp pilus assembly protein PilF